MPQGAGEANGFFQKMRDKYLRDVDFRKIEKFKELGCELLIYKGKIEGYSPTAFWVSDKELIQAFTAKIKALNKSDFSCFRSNDLYIFSPLFKVYDLEDIDKFSKKAADVQLQFERKFDSIYINDFGYFFKCNLLDATSLQIPICDEQLHGYNVLAKKFIDGQSINE